MSRLIPPFCKNFGIISLKRSYSPLFCKSVNLEYDETVICTDTHIREDPNPVKINSTVNVIMGAAVFSIMLFKHANIIIMWQLNAGKLVKVWLQSKHIRHVHI